MLHRGSSTVNIVVCCILILGVIWRIRMESFVLLRIISLCVYLCGGGLYCKLCFSAAGLGTNESKEESQELTMLLLGARAEARARAAHGMGGGAAMAMAGSSRISGSGTQSVRGVVSNEDPHSRQVSDYSNGTFYLKRVKIIVAPEESTSKRERCLRG